VLRIKRALSGIGPHIFDKNPVLDVFQIIVQALLG